MHLPRGAGHGHVLPTRKSQLAQGLQAKERGLRGKHPADSLVSASQPPELWEDASLPRKPPLLRYCYGHPSKLIQGPQGPEFHVSTEAFVRKKSEPGPLAWASRLGLSPEPVPPGMLLMAEAGPGPNTAASSVSEGRQLGAVLGLRLEQAPQGVGCGPCSPFIVQHPVRGPGGCGQHLRSAWGAERPMAGRGVLSHRLVFSPIITLFPSSPIPTVSGEVGPAPTDECPFQLQLDSGFLLL